MSESSQMDNMLSEHLSLESWKKFALGDPDVATLIMGQSPDSSTYNASRIGLPFFQGKLDFGLRHPTPTKWCSSPARVADPGDVLISVRAPVGDANIAVEKCCIGRGVAALKSGPKTFNEFLFYSLLHHKLDLDALGSGAIFKAINKSTLESFEIQLPAVPEQRAIAAVLSKIQDAVEVQEQIVTTLKELKAVTMAKLFREGLRGKALKQTEIGEIPESWEVVPIGECCERPRYGYTESASNDPIGSKFLRITDLTEDGVDWDSVPYCPYPQTRPDEFRLKPGDLVFARIGATTGKSYLITDCPEAVFASYLIRLRAKPGLDPAYLSCFFESEAYWRQIRANRGSNLKGGMSASILASLLFPLPAHDEQREIAVHIRGIQRRTAQAVKLRNTLKSLFSSILHRLMTGRLRVTPKMIALQRVAGRAARRAKWSGKIDEKVLEQVVKRIVEAVAPEKIILFGSAARGEMGPDSDLDLLIVKSDVHRLATAQMIEHSLIGITIPTDIVVATPKDIEAHKNTIGLIYRPALQEGKILYAA